MISDITLGQFFPGYSVLHKLDPRTKIVAAAIAIASVFVASSPVSFIMLAAITLLLIAISRISYKVIWRGVKPIVVILVITSLINLFMTVGEGEPLLDFWIFTVYREGIVRAIFMTLRVVILIVVSHRLYVYDYNKNTKHLAI